MKKLIRLLVFTALVATLALPALAQTTPSTTTPATPAAGGQDDPEVVAALYKKFTDNFKANPPVAYEAGKEYLQKYEAKAATDDEKKIVAYIRKWVDSYDKIARRNQLIQQLTAKDYNSAFALSKQVLTDFPDDLHVLFELSKAGLAAVENGNKNNSADTVAYAKKTIQLLQSGKTFEKDKPVANKDEIVGGLNYLIGFLLQESQPAEATNYLITAAQFEGFSKKDPRTYNILAGIYEKNEYATLATQFNNNCKTPEQLATPDCTTLKAKADQVVDRMIDALARAIHYSNSGPNAAGWAQARTAWTEALTNYYKYRHEGSDAGLKELIAGIAAKPLPRPGDPAAPATTPPATTTTPTTPGTTTNTTPSNNSATSATTVKPSSTTTPASTTTQSNGRTPTKTTPKRAHAPIKRG
jgi:hypothetical protein